ncbi:hypothetical protein PQX77_002768 [Marasmius sp. AFHP31]|nr:hypothetical protein PQX77_002768 [Marasmius sp. AFHP31]
MTEGSQSPSGQGSHQSTGDRLRIRLGLVKANSLSNEQRQKKTHTPALVEFNTTIPFINKLKNNYKIWQRNMEKKEQDQRCLENPDNLACIPMSPQASLWSLTEEEEERLKFRPVFKKVKAWLTPEKAEEIEKHLEGTGTSGDVISTLQAAAGSKQTDKIPVPEVIERKRDDTAPEIPPYLPP